jgi:TP901 family phage tail tape measure protein
LLVRGLHLAGAAVLAVGAIATKMALDYEDAFTKIAAVSNASASDIEKWKGQVLELAGKTAQAPKELADALFFLASAGLKTSQIMPVLEASAKASAAGLGETADIAKLTANVLNAYAGSGLKAADATDILVAAVREGSADSDEFGTAIGRILPIASAAGVGFDSVAASLAALSNVGLDVNEGTTAMRGVLQALVAPSNSAALALGDIGLSAQQLLDSFQQDGLIATIRLLDEAIKKNTVGGAEYNSMFRTIVPNVRALTGVLGLTEQQAERVDGLFQRVANSTGSLNEAFNTTAESAGFKLRQALVELQVVMIQLGDIILPVLVSVVGFIQDNWEPAWKKLSETVTNAWDAVRPFAVAIGNVLLPLFETMWHTIQDRILPVLERIKPLLIIIGAAIVLFATTILVQFALVVTAVGFVIDKFLDLVGFIRDKVVEPVVNFLGRIVDFVLDKLRPIWDVIRDAASAAFRAILTPIQWVIDKIQTLIGWIQNAVEWLGRLLSEGGAGSKVGSDTGRPGFNTNPIIPEGATGGFVARSGLAVIHKGETLVPAGMGGMTVIINGDVTGEEIVRKVRDGLLRLGNRNAGTGL